MHATPRNELITSLRLVQMQQWQPTWSSLSPRAAVTWLASARLLQERLLLVAHHDANNSWTCHCFWGHGIRGD
jgi:hypothetical protein